MTKSGQDYTGPIAITRTGTKCFNWEDHYAGERVS